MDSERFTDIFSRLQSGLRRFAFRIVGNEVEAEDAVQEAFCSLWRRRDDVTDDNALAGMMTVSVRNRCVSELRRRGRYPTAELEDSVPEQEIEPSPDALFSEVQSIMEKYLSERDRRILLLREHSGWEFDDIARKFDMTPAAVRMALSRARKGVLTAYRERSVRKKI